MHCAGLVKSSLVDYPGSIAAVWFVPGCNYDCFYCHNRSLIDGAHQLLQSDEAWRFLEKRAGLLEGLVITGGEPTLQPGLEDFIRRVRGLGYKVKLDTNGGRPQVVARLLQEGLCDYYAVDYKAPATRYPQIAGVGADPAATRQTIDLLLAHGANFQVRTTVFPQLSEDDLLCMAQELPVVPLWVLNPYRMPPRYKQQDLPLLEAPPHNPQQMTALAVAMQAHQPHAVCPGK